MRPTLLWIVLFSIQGLEASPPVDLTDFSGYTDLRKPVEKKVQETDITFGEVDRSLDPKNYNRAPLDSKTAEGSKLEVKYTVLGRSLPHRKGKALIQFKKASMVKFLRFSKNQRWVAIETLGEKSGKKSWVPRAAFFRLDPKKEILGSGS